MPQKLLDLPPEVLTHIINYIDVLDDRQNVRFTCRTFADIGAAFLLRDVFFSKNNFDLAILRDSISHNHIARGIRTMVCDDTTFLPYCSQPFYRQMYHEEQDMRQSGRALEVLSTVFQSCPKLREVTITDCWSCYRTPIHRYGVWDMGCPEPQPWGKIQNVADVWDATSTPYFGFVVLIRALSRSKHQITSLEIEGQFKGISHRIFHIPQTDFVHVSGVFATLKVLKLAIDTNKSEAAWSEITIKKGRLSKALQQAVNLESLELAFKGLDDDDDGNDQPTELDLAAGLPLVRWQHLRHFGLVYARLDHHRPLLAFLKRHRNTLSSLRLDTLELVRSTWQEVLEDFRLNRIQLEICDLVSIVSNRNDQDSSPDGMEVIRFLEGIGSNPCSSN